MGSQRVRHNWVTNTCTFFQDLRARLKLNPIATTPKGNIRCHVFIVDVYEQYETPLNARTSHHEVWLPREDPLEKHGQRWERQLDKSISSLILSLLPPKSWLVLTNPTLCLNYTACQWYQHYPALHLYNTSPKNNVWSLMMMLMTHIWQMISLYFVVKIYPSHR